MLGKMVMHRVVGQDQRSAAFVTFRLPPCESACHFCLERYRSLTSWELNFVATVARYQKAPSAEQLIILQRLVARCRNVAA